MPLALPLQEVQDVAQILQMQPSEIDKLIAWEVVALRSRCSTHTLVSDNNNVQPYVELTNERIAIVTS